MIAYENKYVISSIKTFYPKVASKNRVLKFLTNLEKILIKYS